MLRRLIIVLIFTGAFSSAKAQDSAFAIIKFDEQVHWISSVHEGDVAEYKFHFVNTGNAPLLISEVAQTIFVPENAGKEPIPPGGSGFVVVRYQTSNHPGYFDKTATIKSNSRDGDVVLHLKGDVIRKPQPDDPVMKFDSTTYWFDTVYQSTIVDAHYRFTNTGKSPLIITMVTGSSGSICPSYPKEPIAPGQSGEITVLFHTGGKMGPQDKTVTITSNASEPTIVLHVKGYVILPPPLNKTPVIPENKSGQ